MANFEVWVWWVVLVLGIVSAIVGLILLSLRVLRKGETQTLIEIFGFKIQTGGLGLLVFIVGCIIVMLPLILPQILPISPPPNLPENLILSNNTEIFNFNDETLNGWKPLEWDTGWVIYETSGNLEIVKKSLDHHKGTFLKYPLHLKSKGLYEYLIRNAIYKPIDETVIGILANIYYESEQTSSFEKIYAGFVVPYMPGRNEGYLKPLIPNKWNTLVWSLYGPIWWDGDNKKEKWKEFKELLGDENYALHPGRRLDDTKIESIGIQFYVTAKEENVPTEFRGTAYIDNIILIYRHDS